MTTEEWDAIYPPENISTELITYASTDSLGNYCYKPYFNIKQTNSKQHDR